MNAWIGIRIGTRKQECEDTAFFNQTVAKEGITLCQSKDLDCVGVADGVGGNPGGRLASRFLGEDIARMDLSQLDENAIYDFAQKLNGQLLDYAAAVPGQERMASTLTCIVAGSDGYYLIHSGNTRVYAMQGAYLKQLSTDHTTYHWLMSQGEYEAAQRCRKSEIHCCFGGGDPRLAQAMVVEKLSDHQLPDTIVLTSDGIHDHVDIDTLENIMNTPITDRERITLLMEKATANGSTDDKTLLILRC